MEMEMSGQCFEHGSDVMDALKRYDYLKYEKEDIELVLDGVFNLFTFSAKHDTPNLSGAVETQRHALSMMKKMVESYWRGEAEIDMGMEETATLHASRTFHLVTAWIERRYKQLG